MPKHQSDIINELLTRSVTDVVPRELANTKLASGKKLRIYFGIDPTGDKLHLGHAVPLRKLQAFQEAGHEVILVIGSALYLSACVGALMRCAMAAASTM